MRQVIPIICLLLLITAGPAPAQESARAIVARAVQAHGGIDRLAKLRADHIRVKGTLMLGAKPVAFVGQTLVQLPDRQKSIIQLSMDGKSQTLVQIVNGDQAWVTLDGQPQKIDAAALNEMRGALALARAMRLVPLLTDRTYELTALGEGKVGDRPVLGVKVSAKGRKDIRLFFDKETGLLVKTEHYLDDAAGKEVPQEEIYSDFRDLGGYKRPTKIAVFRKGGKVAEMEMVDVKYYESFPEAEFAKP